MLIFFIRAARGGVAKNSDTK